MTQPFCGHYKICSGCNVNPYDSFPPVWQDVLNYFQSKKFTNVQFIDGPRIKWRHRAKLAVRGNSENPLIGLFKEGSHNVEPIPFCQTHHPSINQAVESIQNMIKKFHLEPYDERSGQGELRYIQLVVERSSSRVQGTFVLNLKNKASERFNKWKLLLRRFGEAQKDPLWHSLWINLNDLRTNTIFGVEWACCFGDDWLWEKFGTLSICYHPSNFAQANLPLFEVLMNHVSGFIRPRSKIAEYYAGVGVIGLFLAAESEWVRCVEMNSFAEKSFNLSRSKLGLEVGSRVTFHTGVAQNLLSLLDEADTIIVDPPRKGLDISFVEKLKKIKERKQLIYISCGWNAFKRDCDALLESGWKLEQVEGFLFFPGTDQIEILAVLKSPISLH